MDLSCIGKKMKTRELYSFIHFKQVFLNIYYKKDLRWCLRKAEPLLSWTSKSKVETNIKCSHK